MNLVELVKKVWRQIWQDSQLTPEALFAYANRLPESVMVTWFRDGEFIIGHITAEQLDVMTQATTPREFVTMVNDAVFAAYEIPVRYFSALSARSFRPVAREYQKLSNRAIANSSLIIERSLA